LAPSPKYRTLDPALIIKSLETLVRRFQERFPGARLASVCRDLVAVTGETTARTESINRPHLFLRFVIWVAITAGLALLIAVAQLIFVGTKATDDLFGTLQGIDSCFNIVVLTGATLYFVSSLETRWKSEQRLNRCTTFAPSYTSSICIS
jgi:hypothetical protein